MQTKSWKKYNTTFIDDCKKYFYNYFLGVNIRLLKYLKITMINLQIKITKK